MEQQLTKEEIDALRRLLRGMKQHDIEEFYALMRHAKDIDSVITTAEAIGRVGRGFRTLILFLASVIVAFGVLSAWLKDGLKGWLN